MKMETTTQTISKLTQIPSYFEISSEQTGNGGVTLTFNSDVYSDTKEFSECTSIFDLLSFLPLGTNSKFVSMLKRMKLPPRFELTARPINHDSQVELRLTLHNRRGIWMRETTVKKPKLEALDLLIVMQWLNQAKTFLKDQKQ